MSGVGPLGVRRGKQLVSGEPWCQEYIHLVPVSVIGVRRSTWCQEREAIGARSRSTWCQGREAIVPGVDPLGIRKEKQLAAGVGPLGVR